MMPFHSWSVPGRKPGTSTKVSTGMLKASQVRTKRAAFSEASMSRHAGELHRLVGHDADRAPSTRPKPTMMFGANSALDLEELAVVEHVLDHRVHVVRLVGGVRDQRVEREVVSVLARAGLAAGRRAGRSRLLLGR